MDQIYGKNGPGTPKWDTHDNEITKVKNQIDDLMKDYIKNNCGGPGGANPIGVDAKQWINRPNPTPDEWKGPRPEAAARFWDWKYWEQATGLSGTALALYLLVSEGSRVFPPRDLVPVP